MGNQPVEVRSLDRGPFTTLLLEGAHGSIADEPAALGGLGLGPDPYDLLLMSLGACTAMTLRLFARRKGWQLDDVSVELSHGRVHADDCVECETQDVFIERINLRVTLRGPLTADQKLALMAIAGSCPVHRTLSGRIAIESTLNPGTTQQR